MYLLRRLALLPILLFLLVTVTFVLVNAIPNDPAQVIGGSNATPAALAQIRHQLGLDLPLWQQFVDYLNGVIHGDLGNSYVDRSPVLSDIFNHATSSLEIIVPALALAAVAGTAFGSTAAYRHGTQLDHLLRRLMSLGQSVPEFVIGVLLIFFAFYTFGVVPAPSGQLSFTDAAPPTRTGAALVDAVVTGQTSTAVSAATHLILPVITLSAALAVFFARTARTVMTDSLGGPATEFARACGLPERKIIRYAFKQSRTPVITYIGTLFAASLGGVAIVEIIFSWNGLGQWGLDKIIQLDLPVIEGFVIVIGAATLIVYAFLEVLVVSLDPRLS